MLWFQFLEIIGRNIELRAPWSPLGEQDAFLLWSNLSFHFVDQIHFITFLSTECNFALIILSRKRQQHNIFWSAKRNCRFTSFWCMKGMDCANWKNDYSPCLKWQRTQIIDTVKICSFSYFLKALCLNACRKWKDSLKIHSNALMGLLYTFRVSNNFWFINES